MRGERNIILKPVAKLAMLISHRAEFGTIKNRN